MVISLGAEAVERKPLPYLNSELTELTVYVRAGFYRISGTSVVILPLQCSKLE